MPPSHPFFLFFFFNDTATTEIYTLSLHDALPILRFPGIALAQTDPGVRSNTGINAGQPLASVSANPRSEEHTSELQSQSNLVCRLLLEKKKKNYRVIILNYKNKDSDTFNAYRHEH